MKSCRQKSQTRVQNGSHFPDGVTPMDWPQITSQRPSLGYIHEVGDSPISFFLILIIFNPENIQVSLPSQTLSSILR